MHGGGNYRGGRNSNRGRGRGKKSFNRSNNSHHSNGGGGRNDITRFVHKEAELDAHAARKEVPGVSAMVAAQFTGFNGLVSVGHDGKLAFLDINQKSFVHEEQLGGEGHTLLFEHPFLFVGYDKETPLVPGVTVGMIGVYLLGVQPMVRKDLVINEAQPYAHGSRVAALTVGGTLLISGGGDGVVRLWHYDDAQKTFLWAQDLLGHVRPVSALCYLETPEGIRLWSGSEDRTIRIWNVAPTGAGACVDMKSVARASGEDPGGHSHTVTSLTMVPGDRAFILSTGVDGKLIVWDAMTSAYCGGTDCGVGIQGVELGALSDPTDNSALSCLFISCRSGDFQIREWDEQLTLRVNTQRNSRSARGGGAHNFGCSAVVALDAGSFYTAGRDGKIMVWAVRK